MAVPIPSFVDFPPLLVLLADGRLHSGAWLAEQLGVSCAAVRKGMRGLREHGIEIEAQARRGYCLPLPVELLEERRIRSALSVEGNRQLRGLRLPFEVSSTNTCLLEAPPPPFGSAEVCLCEIQRAGRGRRGRPWIAPFGMSLAISLGWAFRDASRVLPSLSLAVGVAVSRALVRAGARGISLKWPNDIWFNERKIGGVLIESRAEAGGHAYVVIGVGLNVSLSAAARRKIEQTQVRTAAVADACPEPPSRNLLAGTILGELLGMLAQFEREGFAPFRQAWTELDALDARPVQVTVGEDAISGFASGVDSEGALLLETDGKLRKFVSGEASLRSIEVAA
jgi:BirA family biotin operon repressor/biotin-[acetyl-CoA-carboxylase] ligase